MADTAEERLILARLEATGIKCRELLVAAAAMKGVGDDAAARACLLHTTLWWRQVGHHRAGVSRFLRDLAELVETGKSNPPSDEILELAQSGLAQQQAMKAGRAAGSEARRKERERKLAQITEAMRPLVAAGMKNEAIVSHLMERGLSPYSRASTEVHVKRIRPTLRRTGG